MISTSSTSVWTHPIRGGRLLKVGAAGDPNTTTKALLAFGEVTVRTADRVLMRGRPTTVGGRIAVRTVEAARED